MSGSSIRPHQRARQLRSGAPLADTARGLGISERQLRRIEAGKHAHAPYRETRRAYLRVYGEDPWRAANELAAHASDDAAAARMALGERLRERRRALGLTQEALSHRGRERFARQMAANAKEHPERQYFWSTRGSHLSAATVSRWERGVCQSGGRWETAFALALALEVNHSEWFGRRPTARWMQREITLDVLGLPD